MSRRRKCRSSVEPTNFAQAQAAAFDDARALALEIARGVPSRPFDAMSAGLVLFPEETAYRSVGAWLVVHDSASWAAPSWTQILITDQRLLCRFEDGRLVSLRWAEVTGVRIALEQQHLILNYGREPPMILSGYGSAAIAVTAVLMLYGVGALLSHPALADLRVHSD